MIILLFIAVPAWALCECFKGICYQERCYCQAPWVGEHCDHVLQYAYGMTHQHSAREFISSSTNITDNDCQSDCNNHGLCLEGKCHCASPYGGDECQFKVQLESPPAEPKLNDSALPSEPLLDFGFNIFAAVKQLDKKQMYKKCAVPCRNDGMCVYGQCMCKSPYVGDYCQYIITFEYGIPHYQVAILCIFCFILGAALIIVIFMILKMRDEAKKKYELISAQKHDKWQKR